MRNRVNTSVAICICFCLVCVCWTMAVRTQTQKTVNKDLVLEGKPTKEVLILGEPVTIQFEFTNVGESSLFVPKFGVEVGSLKIFIAGEDKGYKEYFAAGWGRQTGRAITLEPKRSYQLSEVAMLWNGKPNLPHLNKDAAERAMAGKLTTEYVFPESGVYFVKGVSYFSTSGEKGTFFPVESEPIQIEVKNPEGEDLEIWKQIRGSRGIARLMQSGTFGTDKEEQKQGLVEEAEKIIQEHPNSIYVTYLKPNLEKYKTDEIRRKEMLERATIRKN